MGTRNALALARQNMGYEEGAAGAAGRGAGVGAGAGYGAAQPQMSERGNEWGAGYGGAAQHAYPPYNHQQQEAYGQQFDLADPRDAHYNQNQHGDYAQYDQQYNSQHANAGQYEHHYTQSQGGQGQGGEQFADLARQLDVPAVALTPAYGDEHERYDSHTAPSPTPHKYEYDANRSGTPVEANSRLGARVVNGQGDARMSTASRGSVYDDDAYGGI